MAGELYIGVDLGTTGVKVGLFDAGGRALSVRSKEFGIETPEPGHAEFDADEYTDLAFEGIRGALAESGAESASVKGIGLSSQAQTFVIADDEGRPVRRAVSWLDVRAPGEARELSAASTGLGLGEISAIASGPKLLWLMRNEGETYARARRVMVIADYLIFRLTGRPASDPITAGSTGLFDRRRGAWVAELAERCGLRVEMMSDVLAPGEVAGKLTTGAADALGLTPEVIVAVGTNDQSAGALGAGNVAPGRASVTLGTALAIMLTARDVRDVPKGVGVSPHPAGGDLQTLLAYAKTAGIVLRWFRDTFAPGLSYEELIAEAASAPIGSGGVSCLPHFSGTATPSFNPDVRGAFSGVSLAHGRSHMARTVLESLAFTVRENVELLSRAAVRPNELRAVGGGARSDFWLQMISDASGLVVERPRTLEAACLGAAELAMVAAGRFGSIAAASRELYEAERRFEPDESLRGAYDEAFARYRALYESLYGEGGSGE